MGSSKRVLPFSNPCLPDSALHDQVLTDILDMDKDNVQIRLKDLADHCRYLQEQLEQQAHTIRTAEHDKTYLQTILTASHDGILVVNAEGNFEFANPSAFDILGWPEEELFGGHFLKVVPPDMHESVLARWDQIRSKQGEPYELDILRKDGSRRNLIISPQKMQVEDTSKYCVILKDITDRHEQEKAVIRAKQEWEKTFDCVPDLIAVLDQDCRIRRINRAMAAHLGMRESECIGRNCCNLLHGRDDRPEDCPHRRLFQNAEEITLEIYLPRLKGHYCISASPLHDMQGQVIGAVHVARDISKMKKTQKNLEEHRTELQMRNQDLTAFSHTVAHDLKGPLGNIANTASLVRQALEKKDYPHAAKYADIMNRGAKRASTIVDELLVLAEIRTRKVLFQTVEMRSVVLKALDSLHSLIREYRATIHLPESFPVAIGHAPWLVEVWSNYLSNAIKYGGQPPEIHIDAFQKKEHVLFSVQDNGNGLPEGMEERVFLPFERLNELDTRGHGLGLSIVKNIVSKHNGEVGADSRPTGGSVFYFTLPCKRKGAPQ